LGVEDDAVRVGERRLGRGAVAPADAAVAGQGLDVRRHVDPIRRLDMAPALRPVAQEPLEQAETRRGSRQHGHDRDHHCPRSALHSGLVHSSAARVAPSDAPARAGPSSCD